jgi:phage terminase small subunit
MKERKLTTKQKFFIAEYQKDWNATQAAIRAGYSTKNADVIADQLLGKTWVSEAIEKAVKAKLEKIGVHVERVLMELAKVAFSEISNAYNDDGTLKLPKDWPEDLKGVIAGVETFEEFSGRGEDRELIGFTKKLRTFDKVKSLELLGKHLKLFPSERKGEDAGLPKEEVPLTNLELSAKIVYLVQLAIKKQQERKQWEKQEQISEK